MAIIFSGKGFRLLDKAPISFLSSRPKAVI